MIEKHFILSNKLNSYDKKFSITPYQLKDLSNLSKKFYTLGDGNFKIQVSEKNSIKFRRSIFAIKDIEKGEKFTKKNINTFRPTVGLSSKNYFKILGKRAKKKNIMQYPDI